MRRLTCCQLRAVWLGLLAAAIARAGAPTALLSDGPAPDAVPVQADAAPAKPAVVSRIEITGLQQIDEQVVRDAMQLKVGSPFEAAKMQADVDAIYGLGWFFFSSNAAVQSSVISRRNDADGNVEIIMRLVENPVIDSLRFIGAQTLLGDDVLAENLAWLKVGQPLNTNPERVSRSLRTIEQLYRDGPKIDVVASVPRAGETPRWFEPTPDGKVVVNIMITQRGATPQPVPTPTEAEPTTPPTPTTPTTPTTPAEPPPVVPGREEPVIGQDRLRVTAIEVLGLKNLREDLVLQTISTKVGQMYDQEQLKEDVNTLYELGWFYAAQDRANMLELGYPVPKGGGTNALPVSDPERQGVKIVFNMVENPLIKAVNLINNTLLDDDKLLSDLVFLQPGKVLNTDPERIERDRERVREAYQKQGYVVEVDIGSTKDNVPLLTPEPDGSVTVTMQVTELKVGSINFEWEGKQKTRERVLRAYMKTRPGDYFNINRITDDVNEIRRLDILEEIRPRDWVPSVDDPDRIDLTFEVMEKRTGNISAGGGISSRFGLVGFVDVAENNLWGLAQRGSARVEFGGRFNFSTSYFYPLLDGAGSEVSVRLYNTEDRTGATGFGAFTNRRANFDQTRRGMSVLYSRPIIPTLRGSVEYALENVSTQRRGSQLPNLPPFPFQDLGSDTTSSVTIGLTHDTRDYPFDAAKGMYQNATFEIAGLGGDNNFGKYRLETRHYFPMFGGTVPRGRNDTRPAWVLATRAVAGFSSGAPPFSQSFFVGGSETLRGYEEDRFFGDRMVLFNLELRRAFKNNIQAVAFFDAGRAWFKGEDLDFFNDLASAVGVGVRVNTPVGPIRLDIGFGPDGNKTHFSFGQPF